MENIDESAKTVIFSDIKIWISIVAFFIGLFIQGIRYLGFEYYIKIHKKAQKNRKGGKYPTTFQRIFFYIFRNGTVVEECLDNISSKKIKPIGIGRILKKIKDKKYRAHYKWIQESKQPAKDLWILAEKIKKDDPNNNIYQFYYWSEVFQCLDTTFLLLCIIYLLSFITNFLLYIIQNKGYSIMIPIIITLLSLIFHRLSKSCAKASANRFLFAIEKDYLKKS
jgi:hypothetical protein